MKKFYSKTYLDHDTALQLSKDCEEFKIFSLGVPIKNNHRLLVLRKDIEAVFIPRKILKKDYNIICDPAYLKREDWLKLHLWASEITTNRCHSAILGTILDKKVNFYANSYHKNRSIWEYSLRNYKVNWIKHQFVSKIIINLFNYLQKFCGYLSQKLFFRWSGISPIYEFAKIGRRLFSKI